MNEQHPYDKSLAEKLKKLPMPDIEMSWQQMHKLLDNEMPEGGGYSRRRGGWWLFGGLLVFIIGGSLSLMKINTNRQNADPPLSNSRGSSPRAADQEKKEIRKHSETAGNTDDKILPDQDNKIVNPSDKETTLSGTDFQKSGSSATDGGAPGGIVSGLPFKEPSSGKRPDPVVRSGAETRPDPVEPNAGRSVNPVEPKTGIEPNSLASGSKTKPDAIGDPATQKSLNPSFIKGVQPLTTGSYASLVDSVNNDHLEHVQYAYVSRKYYRRNKKYGIPANIKEPYTTVGRTFAFGLSLPLGFPLGDQKMLGYNVNAGPNTVTDYLPAPNIQYHFNGKSYIQSELQVVNPQFIKPVLLYQNHYSNSTSNNTSSIYARKLYYFNVPVSVHYSPFKHFYMGTGLQFSSLLSGVAMHEQIRTGMVSSDSLYRVSYSKFSNDSLSRKLNSSEMRLLLDANYYWNRFTVGLRYNQALSNYVNIRVGPAVPYTLDKNKSLQFYMRYNLWEEKKWKSPGKRVLALK